MQFVTCKIALKILNICSYKSRIKNRKIHVKEIPCCRIWIISMIDDRSSYRYTHEITFHVPSHSVSGCRTCLAFSDLATSGAAARSSGFLVYVYLLFEPVLIKRTTRCSIRMLGFYLSIDRPSLLWRFTLTTSVCIILLRYNGPRHETNMLEEIS